MSTTQLTDLEKRVASALRLSPAATTLLLTEIQDNIATARAELIRSGVPAAVAEGSGKLAEQAIVTYCLMNMNDEDKYEQYFSAFQYQQDNLRKSIHEE
jgi:hypothetical protein